MDFDRVPQIAKYLSLVYMLTWLGASTVWQFLPLFFEQHISSVFLIGVLTALPPLVCLLLDIPMGNLVQRAGETTVIFIGLMLHLTPGLFYLMGIPLFIILGRAMEGVVKSMVWNGGWTLSLRSGNESNESQTQSVFLLGTNLAMIVGPIIGGVLIAAKGFEATFALWIFTAWLAVLTFYLYVGLEGKKGFLDSMEDLFHRKTYVDDFHHLEDNWNRIRLPLLLIFLQSIIFSFFWLAVPLLLNDVGASYELMGVVFGLAALPSIFQYLFGEWADKIGYLKQVSVLSILLIPALGLMGFSQSVFAIGGLFLIAILFTNGITPAAHAFYDSRVPDSIEGEMTGFMEFSKHTGQSIGPIMAGAVASVWSISASFFAAAFIAILIFITCIVNLRKL